mmetsp:Transcript_23098/g.54593  ORF Transcript_23098/g.54593 Transcript_23098/m.54593 type:complete len:273 (+) Transcript_23098:265-1083(+)
MRAMLRCFSITVVIHAEDRSSVCSFFCWLIFNRLFFAANNDSFSSISSSVRPFVSGTFCSINHSEYAVRHPNKRNVNDSPSLDRNTGTRNCTTAFNAKFVWTANATAVPRMDWGKTSEIINQEIGPKPIWYPAIYANMPPITKRILASIVSSSLLPAVTSPSTFSSRKAIASTIRAASMKEHPVIRRILRPFRSTNTTDTVVATTLNRARKTEALDDKLGTFASIGVAYDKTLGWPVICWRITNPNPALRAGRNEGLEKRDTADVDDDDDPC